MDQIVRVSEYLQENAEVLIDKIVEDALKNVTFEISEEQLKLARKQNTEFLRMMARSFPSTDEEAAQELSDWADKQGENNSQNMEQFSQSIEPFAQNRLIYSKHISQVALDLEVGSTQIVRIMNRFNYLLDVAMVKSIKSFEKHQSQKLKERQKLINELSAPIVPVQEGVAILPLIGIVDYDRMTYILNYVIPKIPKMEVDHLIIDFSGILTIDSEIAQHIFTLHNVLQLLGINLYFTGMRPNITMAIVQGNIDFSDFHTFGSVLQALAAIEKSSK
ncbi:STAS domain-containing protein [Chryseomicrobium sp. FSL W7-1435]|uniref:STAS domain-containing protein n=1 Tax=Chryseomicrobium sp. FSL W7-1435 TaxID=2921704 RepID=UPI00315AC641